MARRPKIFAQLIIAALAGCGFQLGITFLNKPMNTINIRLYDFAKQKFNLSDADAKEFIEIIAATTGDDIKTSSVEYRSVFKEDLFKLEIGLRKDMYSLEISLVKEIKDSKVDVVRYMFIFWIGQVAVIAGILMYLLKK